MNLNNAFASLSAPAVLGTKPAWAVEFKWGGGVNARTIVPDMPIGSVEPFMITKRKVGRGQIVSIERTQVLAR
jgi:hypothetical protein